jgi:indoleamine 2,3-dioxygenase
MACASSFLTSAYLLEPVDRSFRETGKYSPGRSILPRELAQPMVALADKLGQFPYMEYASSYALRESIILLEEYMKTI